MSLKGLCREGSKQDGRHTMASSGDSTPETSPGDALTAQEGRVRDRAQEVLPRHSPTHSNSVPHSAAVVCGKRSNMTLMGLGKTYGNAKSLINQPSY